MSDEDRMNSFINRPGVTTIFEGQIFIVTDDDGPRHCVDGVYRAVRDIDIAELVAGWQDLMSEDAANPCQRFSTVLFFQWVVAQGYMVQLTAKNWYVGNRDSHRFSMRVSPMPESRLARNTRTWISPDEHNLQRSDVRLQVAHLTTQHELKRQAEVRRKSIIQGASQEERD